MTPPADAMGVRTSHPEGPADPADGARPAEELYVPFKGWLDARPGRYVIVGAIGLIVLQALVRGYVKFGGWFIADDMSFIGRAEHMPFLSREYLLSGWNGHLMPGSFALVRLLNELWPVNYVPVALVDIGLQAATGVLAFTLLVSLFGRRPAILVPLAVYLFSPITLPAFLWWAAALNQLPGQVAMIAALLFQVRYHRAGRLRDGVLGAVSVGAGLLFSEKVLLVLPCVFALTLLYFTPGPPLARLRAALRENWPVWTAYAVVVVPYVAYYATNVPSPVGSSPSVTIAVQTAGTALTSAVLPALFGGPLRWQQIGVGGVADPGTVTVLLACTASALLVWLSVVRRRRAVFGWVVVTGYWLSNAVLLGVTRATYVGPIIGSEYRYSTDVAIIIAVFGAAAFLPLRGSFVRGIPQRLLPRTPSLASRLRVGVIPRRPDGGSYEGILAGGVCCAIIVAALVSTMQYDTFWRENGSPEFFGNARHDIEASGRHLTLSEVNLPDRVQAGFIGSFITTSTMMSGFEPEPRFLTPGTSAGELYIPDDTGHLRAVWVDGFHGKPGPEVGCGWRVRDRAVRIPLQRTTVPWRWTARIGYLATKEATTSVRVGSVTSKVRIQPGVHELFLIGEGKVDEVRIAGLSEGSLCTDDVAVGFARPQPGTQP